MSDAPLADDLLHGAEAIAQFMGVSPRRVYYLAEKNQLPVFHLGATLTARKSELAESLSSKARQQSAA